MREVSAVHLRGRTSGHKPAAQGTSLSAGPQGQPDPITASGWAARTSGRRTLAHPACPGVPRESCGSMWGGFFLM
jgi:hypothetical protein